MTKITNLRKRARSQNNLLKTKLQCLCVKEHSLCYTFLNFSLHLLVSFSGFIIPLMIVIKEKLTDYTQM